MSVWPPALPPWPPGIAALEAEQMALASACAARMAEEGASAHPVSPAPSAVAGCFVCFMRGGGGPGSPGDRGWAAAALFVGEELAATATVEGRAGAAYDPGHLALREGPLLEAALLALPRAPALLLVNATGWDHPRRAGVALHLGARLGVPSVGVTNRTLIARGPLPEDGEGAYTALVADGRTVGYWLRTRRGVRPLAVHAGWRTDPEAAVAAVLACTHCARAPEPIRAARRAAREHRDRAMRGMAP